MPMYYDIFGNGTIIEVSDRDFLNLLTQWAENCYSLASSYIVNHVSCLADFNHVYFPESVQRVQQQYKVASEEIKDTLLRELTGSLDKLLKQLSGTDEKIIEAYKDAIFTISSKSKDDDNLKKMVYIYLHQKHHTPPTVVIQLAQESSTLIPKLEDLHQKIVINIEQLLTGEL